MNTPAVAAPTRASFRSLKECKSLGDAFQCGEFMERIKQSVPAHVNPGRMLRTFLQATSKQPKLLECTMRSVLGAMLTCSEVGLEPNTPLQHAFLIPFERRRFDKGAKQWVPDGYDLQLIFGYPGLLELSYRTGMVTSVHANVAWRRDKFEYSYGTDAFLRHEPKGLHDDTEQPTHAYAHVNLKGGQAFEVMPWPDVLRIRNRSQGFVAALRAKERAERDGKPLPKTWTEAPWVRDEVAMARKTAFRAVSKWLPRSVELAGSSALAAAVTLDEQQDRGYVDFSAVIDHDASAFDGGLESYNAAEDDQQDAGAAYGLREPPQPAPEAPQEDRRVGAATSAPATTQQPPRRPQQPKAPDPAPPPPATTYWLIAVDGEPIGRGHTDPVAYVRAYLAASAEAFPADREALEIANSDDLDRAALASQAAADLLQTQGAAPEPTDEPAPTVDPLLVRPPEKPSQAEWTRYLDDMPRVLALCTSGSMIDHFVTANFPTYNTFPGKLAAEAKQRVAQRRHELSRPAP